MVKQGFLSSFGAGDANGAYPGLELLATAVLLLDPALRVVYANPAAENLFELSKKQLVGQAIAALFADPAAWTARSTRRCAAAHRTPSRRSSWPSTASRRLHLTCTVTPLDHETTRRCCSSSATSTSS